MMAPKSAIANFTDRDMEVLAIAWQCMDEHPRINWQKLADLAHFKNVDSARACFTPIKRKLMQSANTNGDAGEEAHGKQAGNGQLKRKPAGLTSPPMKAKKVKAEPYIAQSIERDEEYKDEYKDIKPKRRMLARRRAPVVKAEEREKDEKEDYLEDEA
ncbi:hypothetical protein GGR52DRAFT_542170 [Hypoxylon sp. FL1284]|nr:hypothetical protein GGR52DRAFT_542170 [Hypoxylon sp. FL1284]